MQILQRAKSRQGSEEEREREGCQMKMLDMQKLKVKGKHFVYPPALTTLSPTHTYIQARRLSQKVPDKMQSAAVSGEETEREKLKATGLTLWRVAAWVCLHQGQWQGGGRRGGSS